MIRFALAIVAMLLLSVGSLATAQNPYGIQLQPGEILVSVDGQSVSQPAVNAWSNSACPGGVCPTSNCPNGVCPTSRPLVTKTKAVARTTTRVLAAPLQRARNLRIFSGRRFWLR